MIKSSRGVSLAEVMIAVMILSVVVIGAVQSFRQITQAIRAGRSKTIAANLVQERMEVLKNMSYYQLLVTTDTDVESHFTPNLTYDRVNYTKETITLWGLPAFSRAVRISYATISSNTVTEATSNSYDTGLKLVTVYLWWQDNDIWKKIELRSLYANPDASNLDSGFKGQVNGYGGTPLVNARVEVVGNNEWQTVSGSGASDNWSMPVTGGTYTLLFSADGYYDKVVSGQTCVRGAYTTVATQQLTQIATGTIAGVLWVSSTPVISMVVASTPTDAGATEFVEVYNPSTYTWLMDYSHVQLWYMNHNTDSPAQIPLNVITPSIAPNGFYLIANRASITIGGVTRAADAVYSSVGADTSKDDSDGAVALFDPNDPGFASLDNPMTFFCWDNGTGQPAPSCGNDAMGTLTDNDQYVRYATTGSLNMAYGPAYNTRDSAANFERVSPILYGPRNSTSGTLTTITGTPAHSAYVFANDGNSQVVTAGSSGMGTNAEYAVFYLTGVTTGTWRVTVAKGNYTQTYTNVVVTQNNTTWIPNSATSPSWTETGYNYGILKSSATGGFIQGYVYGDGATYWTPLSSVLVEANGTRVRTASDGYYLLNTATGAVTVNANYNDDDPTYVNDHYDTTVVEGGFVTAPPSPYFHLGNAAKLTGYVTS
ncbi:MAG: type II secretion system protein, partial [Elusimicrobia bacterium]|nr:type II secretion system protein [Elusimicrobiota bacterium]